MAAASALPRPAFVLTDALRRALREAGSPLADAALEPLADKGLAPTTCASSAADGSRGCPKQSQMGLDATANLAYEAACYQRAAAGGHAPRLEAVLAPGAALARGAQLVEEVVGRPARLPEDLPAIARAMAALHALPLPARRQRCRSSTREIRSPRYATRSRFRAGTSTVPRSNPRSGT